MSHFKNQLITYVLFCIYLKAYACEDAPHRQLQSEPEPFSPSAFWLGEPEEPDVSTNEKLAELLTRVGPNIRASSDYHDFTDIQLNESILAWQLLREQSKLFAQNQVHFYGPKLQLLLNDASVSQTCQKSVKLTLNSMERLESWAIQSKLNYENNMPNSHSQSNMTITIKRVVWSSTGNFPPIGMFDGQFSDLGSYRGCIDSTLTRQHNSTDSSNIEFTNYCTVAFRPVVPSRPRFHMITHKEQKELVDIFNETDVFSKLLHRAQYFHYLYLKTGICVPYQCSPKDIQQVANIVGRRLILMVGPVKCFTLAPQDPTQTDEQRQFIQFGKIENEPVLVAINKPMNTMQLVAIVMVGFFFGIVFFASLWHAIELKFLEKTVNKEEEEDCHIENEEQKLKPLEYSGIKHVAFHYFSIITNGQAFLDTSLRSNEIKCLHGLRVLTMIWIICVHTFQYNEWSGFTRIFENEATLQNPALQPIYNANYVVDNFFFMSGLLAAYTIWLANKGTFTNFSVISSVIGRYLRLTPQVLLVSLLYMILPLAGDSPFWYDMTHYASKYCERNWWINLLHLQAFYKEDEICNLVGWWISVDMLYYVLALALIYMILHNQHKKALLSTILLVGFCMMISAYRHYNGGYTPNNLGTVPQVAEVWTMYIVNFFWSPYPHAYPFYLGFWIGNVLANNKWRRQVKDWSRFGWILATLSLIVVSMSSYIWMSGAVKLGNQYVSTAYNNICTIVWATAFAWVVTACHYGCAPNLNKFLSLKLFVLKTLLEVSIFTLGYVVIGNTCLSTLFGIFLCVAFESPCMKFQKLVLHKIKPNQRQLQLTSATYARESQINTTDHKITIGLTMGPTEKALLK